MAPSAMSGRASPAGLSLYLALSRTPHAVLDLAGPFCAALLCQGGLPPAWIILVGGITVFAGYTAVYALNDIVDYRTDRRLFESLGRDARGGYLDAAGIRHPLAQGYLTLPRAVLWFAAFAVTALIGSLLLNPVCAGLLVFGCLLEAGYCLLLSVSYFRAIVNGVVKSLGPLAAAFAVNPSPSPWFLAGLFAWVFAWEIGGQNIPADWHDAARDRQTGARTVPVVLGPARASRWALRSLAASLVLSVPLLALSPLTVAPVFWLAALAGGALLVLPPAVRLTRGLADADAAALFNRASFYPALVLVALVAFLIVRHAD